MATNLPSLNTLRAFSIVAKTLSYKDAADELGVTPAAVKQLVSKLEGFFGTRLVVRDGQGLKLSAAGQESAEKLAAGFHLITQAAEDMRRRNEPTNRLVISAEPFFAQSWLVPRLHRFRETHPDIDVLIDASMELKSLAVDGIDAVVRYGGSGRLSDFLPPSATPIQLALFSDTIVPLCSPALAKTLSGKANTLLHDQTFIHWDLSSAPWSKQTCQWYRFEHYWDALGLGAFAAQKNIHFTDYNMAVQAAISGQGIVLGSLPILEEMVAKNMLAPAMPEQLETDIGYEFIGLGAPKNRGSVHKFRDWLRAEIEWF